MSERNQHVERSEIERKHEWNLQKLKALERSRSDFDYPLYFITGEDIADPEDVVECYYKVEGPDGPISYRRPTSKPRPTTMLDLVLEAKQVDVRQIPYSETPWAEQTNTDAAEQ